MQRLDELLAKINNPMIYQRLRAYSDAAEKLIEIARAAAKSSTDESDFCSRTHGAFVQFISAGRSLDRTLVSMNVFRLLHPATLSLAVRAQREIEASSVGVYLTRVKMEGFALVRPGTDDFMLPDPLLTDTPRSAGARLFARQVSRLWPPLFAR
jgi:hypothetical protein